MTQNALEIRVDGAVILGRPTLPGDEGIFVAEDGFQGWEGVPDRRRSQVSRAVEHGEHDVPVYLGARTVTIDGWIIANSVDELRELSRTVTGIGASGRRVTVSVRHQQEDLYGFARVVSCEVTDSGRRGRQLLASFQIQLVFADPRKYGRASTFSGSSMVVHHHGNFPAYPVFEVDNAPAVWSVTCPLGKLEIVGAPAGGTHRFDMLSGRLTRDGAEVTGAVVRGDIWSIAPGSRVEHTFSRSGRTVISDTFI